MTLFVAVADRPSVFDTYMVAAISIAGLLLCVCFMCCCRKYLMWLPCCCCCRPVEEYDEDDETLEQQVEMAQRTGRGAAKAVCGWVCVCQDTVQLHPRRLCS